MEALATDEVSSLAKEECVTMLHTLCDVTTWLCGSPLSRLLCVVDTGTYEKWHRHVPHSVKSVEQLPHWGAEASWMNACVQQPNCPGRVSMCYPTIPPRQ